MKLRTPILIALGLAAAVASLGYSGRQALRSSKDLLYRVDEIRHFAAGEDPYLAPGQDRFATMTYPPSALPVFAPLIAPFGDPAVRVVWLALNLAAAGLLCWAAIALWGRSWPGWVQAGFCLVVLASKPVRGGINLGQFHLIPVALCALSILCLRRGRPISGGLLVGVALAKPTMALPFLGFLAARGHWRALAAALGLQGALLAGASAWLGRSPLALTGEWLRVAKSQEAAGVLDLPSILQRIWPGQVSSSAVSLAVLGLGFVLMARWRRHSDLALASLAMFLAAIFSYHRYYDLVLMVIPLAYFVDRACARPAGGGWAPAAAIALFCAILLVPSNSAMLIPGRPELAAGLEAWIELGSVAAYYAFFLALIAGLCGRDPGARLDGTSQPGFGVAAG